MRTDGNENYLMGVGNLSTIAFPLISTCSITEDTNGWKEAQSAEFTAIIQMQCILQRVFEKTNLSHFATQGTEGSDEGTFDCHKFQDRTDIGGSTQETDDRDKWRRFLFDVANSLVLFLLLLFFFLTLSQRSEIGCLPDFYTWCGLSVNLECMSEMCCTRPAENTGRKNRHFGTIAELCRPVSSQLRHVSTIGENFVKQRYILHVLII